MVKIIQSINTTPEAFTVNANKTAAAEYDKYKLIIWYTAPKKSEYIEISLTPHKRWINLIRN